VAQRDYEEKGEQELATDDEDTKDGGSYILMCAHKHPEVRFVVQIGFSPVDAGARNG